MKISIITVCLNAADTIEETIQSVFTQTYSPVEYIVIDGKSTDGTLEILHKYKHRFAALISEKDTGLYAAINKGVKMATGDVIGILHADDMYTSANVLEEMVALVSHTNSDAVYADLEYVRRENPSQIVRYWKSGKYKNDSFRLGWMPPHPTFFVKRTIYERFGYFNESFTSAGDYEFMLRVIHIHKIKLAYWPHVAVRMRLGGKSNKSLTNRLKANNEDVKAWEVNGLKTPAFISLLKPFRKVPQFFPKLFK
ncbi:MAG: glycosyltransferase [Bacteroidia bacterium]|nr:glycosyltransferase [Bacteroidia bacterium]